VRAGDVQWLEPELVVQVGFGEWTHDGRLRHSTYLGVREDVS
jgi:ATP-dependent DNA ligase